MSWILRQSQDLIKLELVLLLTYSKHMKQPSTRKRNNRTRTTLIILLAVILFGTVGWFVWSKNNTDGTSSKQATHQSEQKYTTFDGTVTAMDNGCAYDATCSVSVDGKAIITGGGLSANPDANVYGATDADLAIGDKVSVKALSSDHGLTLQGCSECHITRGSVRHHSYAQ